MSKNKKHPFEYQLFKMFDTPYKHEKMIYKGSKRGCETRIKPSQKDRFRVIAVVKG